MSDEDDRRQRHLQLPRRPPLPPAAEGHDRLELESCVDEVWDMVKPASLEGITLRDLERCKVGHIVTLILADSAGFLAYDTRESQQQAPLFADVAGEEGASS